jgi:pilus assembly protein FimV
VLKTLLKAVGLLACLAWLNLSNAANMGGINVTSALGHPLKAEISLGDLGKNDQSTLAAKMASVNEFKSAGLDYPYSLPKLTFEIATRANGESYLKLSSTQPVNEPFVSLLIELSWPSGKLLREFTFLLDPAGFTPEQPKVAEVKPVEPMLPVVEPLPAVVPLPVPEVMPEAAVTPVEPELVVAMPLADEAKEVAAESDGTQAEAKPERVMSDMDKAELAAELAAAELAKAEQLAAEPGKVEPVEAVKVEPLAPTPPTEAASSSVLVEKGDTLGKIADAVKPVDVSLERMLVAMYRANAKSFDGKNMNRIRAGKILRMPESDEISKVTQAAAVKEIRAQVADWQDYRQKLAAAQPATIEEAPKQEAAGKINAAVAEKAPVIKETAKEVLKLSKGETLGDKAVTGTGVKSTQEKLADKADDAAAKNKQLQEEKKKIAKLEEIQKDASKLVELKGLPSAPVEKNAAEAKAPVAKGLPAVSAVPATQVEAELDMFGLFNKYMSMLLDDPMLLGAGVAVLLGLGGLGMFAARRAKGTQGTQKKSSKKVEEVGSATGSWRTPVAPSPDTGDFTQSSAPSVSASAAAPMSVAAAMDDVDPISEADLFLNFGRDAQAEEILKDALSKNASNVQVKLKLLSIYVNRKDSNSFSKYAQEIKDSGDAAAWERAAVMGRELDPSNPTYGGVKGESRQREPAKAEVDFDLGFGKDAVPVSDNAVAAKDFTMDFDLTGGQPEIVEKSSPFTKSSGVTHVNRAADVDATSILSRADVQAAESASPMDFDVSGILPGEAKQIAESTTMDFDISGILPEEIKKSAQSDTMDFDLTGGGYEDTASFQEPAKELAPESLAMNFNDLVFEIPTSQPKPVQETPKAAVDEGMAFTIDFPTSDKIEAPSSQTNPAANKLDIDFGDININFEEDTPPVHAGGDGKDEQWHEVSTKLDLAKAYQEMGDADGAREILEEVIRDGDATQRESAEKLMQQIAA